MPKIPTFTARGELGVLRLPRPTAESFGADAFTELGNLGAALKKVDDDLRAVEEVGTGEKLLRDMAQGLDDELERVSKEADHQNFLSTYSGSAEKLIQGAREQTKRLSPAGQKAIVPDIERVSAYYGIRANRKSRELKAEHQIAEVNTSLPVLARLAARAELPEERERWEGMARGRVQSLKGLLPAPRLVEIEEGLKKQIQKSRQEFFDTDLQERVAELANKATTDPDNAELYQYQSGRLIDSLDWLPEDKRGEEKLKARSAIWHGAVKTSIDRDPQRLLEKINKGEFNKLLTQQSLLSLRNEAENEIERRRRLAEVERKERERQIGKVVSDYEDARMAGFDWRGPVSEARLADLVKGTEHESKFLNITGASGALAKFNQLTPIAQEEALRRMRQGAKTGFEAKFMGVLERAHEATRRGLESDPLSFAVGQRVVPAPPALNLQDPDSLKERSRLAGIAEQHYGRPVSPLSDDEVEQLRITIEKAPPDGKALILRWLKTGFEDRQIKAIAGQLAKKKEDNVLALAIGLSAEAPQTASRILQGREILKDNPKINPSGVEAATARDRINEQLGEAYLHNPEHHAAVSEAAMALYAQRSWQERDLSGGYNSRRLDEAVKEASGGLLQISRGFLRGRYKIQPPRRGMTEEQFLALVKRADYSQAKAVKAEDIQRHGIFESVKAGQYLIRIGPGYVHNKQGGRFILDLSNK